MNGEGDPSSKNQQPVNEGIQSLADMPSFYERETMSDTQEDDNEADINTAPDTNDKEENDDNFEQEKLREDREVEDLGVLFSFLDIKEGLEIYKSDGYRKLSENDISLLDLFSANALFDEQYNDDGSITEYDSDRRRMRGWGLKYNINNINYPEKDLKKERTEIRAHETRQTIDDIAEIYFSEDSDNDRTSQFLSVVKTRANFEQLSDEQKDFLKNEHNTVADRLLYEGKVINEERANGILSFLNNQEERFSNGENRTNREEELYWAKTSINDYIEAGRPDLVSDAIKKLKEIVDYHFDEVCEDSELVLKYSNPHLLIDRALEYDLGIKPDFIVNTVAQSIESYHTDPTLYLSERASDLKRLGASDEAILAHCHNLRPVDFISPEAYYDGAGARLVEAGIDREAIIREVFSSVGSHNNPFKKNGYPYNNESDVDVLERNGFDITDIAKTFSPDAIAKNLTEFIDHGADAKELMKYMMSYREEFKRNIHGRVNYHMWYDGLQDMIVEDENHPNGREINKLGMHGKNGIEYVMANLDIFANNGVTEEGILELMADSEASPNSMHIPKMLECSKFDKKKILELGFQKYKKFLEDSKAEESPFEFESTPTKYYARVIENLGGDAKKQRDKWYKAIMNGEENSNDRKPSTSIPSAPNPVIEEPPKTESVAESSFIDENGFRDW